ncbi:hypothetical protein POM88_024723 [Heracleum sosnowskyi]|uniref:TTF-type domain-containing protein n=1 Tax=Heracleum sosnowskyi TaxID=360622 RepID=A0AAD8I2K6_9APIA|nr:hypothetical protein POM88_024723 [Heracleum sosnowskyi]
MTHSGIYDHSSSFSTNEIMPSQSGQFFSIISKEPVEPVRFSKLPANGFGRTLGWARVGSSSGEFLLAHLTYNLKSSPARVGKDAAHFKERGKLSCRPHFARVFRVCGCWIMSQDKKRKTLFSYFSSGTATPTPTSSDATPAPTPSDTTPTHIHSVATPTHTPSATPTATSSGTATPSDTSEFDLASLERDPGLRRPIWKYPPTVRDDIRREYIRLGPCQPQLRRDQYPATEFGTQRRRFQASWFNTFKWLEYSVSKDAAFCFPCYLFESDASSQHAFTIDGFKSWKRVNDNQRCAFLVHIGTSNSPHKKAIKDYEGLQNVTRHIDKVINCQSLEEVKKNRLRLRATIEGVRYLSLQACALRGHDESSTSRNRESSSTTQMIPGRFEILGPPLIMTPVRGIKRTHTLYHCSRGNVSASPLSGGYCQQKKKKKKKKRECVLYICTRVFEQD